MKRTESENNYNLSIIQLPVYKADDSFGYFDEGLEKLSSSNTRLIREKAEMNCNVGRHIP